MTNIIKRYCLSVIWNSCCNCLHLYLVVPPCFWTSLGLLSNIEGIPLALSFLGVWCFHSFFCYIWPLKITLPETNSSHLKIGHPKRELVFQPSIFGCNSFVSGSVYFSERTLLACPRKLGSMVSKWVITYLWMGYIGVITYLLNLLLTSWDIQVCFIYQESMTFPASPARGFKNSRRKYMQEISDFEADMVPEKR